MGLHFSGDEGGEELYMPCLCNGSIKYVHEDCLKEWLQVSKQEKVHEQANAEW